MSDVDIKIAFWNKFTDEYSKNFTEHASNLYRLLIPLLRLKESTCIIEAGCGPGNGIEILREIIPVSVKILANDFSNKMIEKCNSKGFENVEFIVGNNECLPYSDCISDRYIANLSLNLVENPVNMLKEAYRLLKPGGIAAFSVWGKSEDSNMFVVLTKAFNNLEIFAKGRSAFHLNNQVELNNMIREAGFSNVKSFYTSIGVAAHSTEEFIEYAKNFPDISDFQQESLEKYNLIIENIRKEADSVFSSGKFITFDGLIAIGFKV